MVFRVLTLLLFLLSSAGAHAFEWQIVPGECLVTSGTEYCDTQLTVTVLQFDAEQPCLVVNNTPKGCFTVNAPRLKMPVRIQADMHIVATSKTGEVIARYTLPFKIIDVQPKRRRVRLPWSVF